MKYETFVGKEVPEYVEKHYPVMTSAKGKAITGLSMGGHGALYLALRHPGSFGACGSMSGAVDLTKLTNKYELLKRLGDTTRTETWKNNSVTHMMEQYNPRDSIAMIIDCGTEDFFFKDNHALHEKMLKLNIPHEYIERPGKHDWKYWTNSVEYQLLFFAKFFNRDIYH
jgi:S-formylglutathione hydrolase FrmB